MNLFLSCFLSLCNCLGNKRHRLGPSQHHPPPVSIAGRLHSMTAGRWRGNSHRWEFWPLPARPHKLLMLSSLPLPLLKLHPPSVRSLDPRSHQVKHRTLHQKLMIHRLVTNTVILRNLWQTFFTFIHRLLCLC